MAHFKPNKYSSISYLAVGSDTDTANGFWSDVDDETPHIWRFRDRIFIGDTASFPDTRTGNTGKTWLPNGTAGASWAIRDGQTVAYAGQRRFGARRALPCQ